MTERGRELANWKMRKWGVRAALVVKLGNLGMRKWGGVRIGTRGECDRKEI